MTIKRWMWAAVLILAAAGTFRFAGNGLQNIFYRYGLNLGEAPLAQSILLFKEGAAPYRELNRPPYSLMPYGPVYPAVVSAAADRQRPFVAGRAVTFGATIAAAWLIALLAAAAGASRPAAALAGLLFLNLPFVERWGVQVNVDMSAVFLDLAAACFLMRALNREPGAKNHELRVGILLALLAFFTKSSAVTAAGGFALALLVRRRFGDLARFALVMGAVASVMTVALNLATGGWYSFHTAYEISKRLFFWQFIPMLWSQVWRDAPFYCLAAAIALIACMVKKTAPYPFLCLLVSVVLTVSLGKQGSETNYFLFFLAYSSVSAGWILGEASTKKRWMAVMLLAACVGQLCAYKPWDIRSVWEGHQARMKQEAFFDRLAASIAKVPDPILSWDMAFLLANNRPIYYEPFPMAQMSYSGVWDQSVILEEIRAKRFKMAILYFYTPLIKKDRNFTPEFLEAFKANYRFVGRAAIPWSPKNLLFFYVPNDLE